MSKGRNLSKLEVSETGSLAASNLNSIVDAAPGALDTLNELAAALGDDANFATSVTNSLALKANASALTNVENKSSSTIRSEITSSNVTAALGYTPVNNAGDTMSNRLIIDSTGAALRARWGSNTRYRSDFGVNSSGEAFLNAYDDTGGVYKNFAISSNEFAVYTGSNAGNQALKIDTSGRIAMQYQPAFRAIKGNATAYASGGEVTYGSAPLNRGSNFNASTGRFTAPVAGVYFFVFQGLTHDVTNYFYFEITINNGSGSTGIVGHLPVTDGGYMFLGASGTIAMAVGDYVSVKQAYNGGAPYFEGRTAFSGYLIG